MNWRYFAFPKPARPSFAILTLWASDVFQQSVAIPDYVAPHQADESEHVRSFGCGSCALTFMCGSEHRTQFLKAV